MSVFSQLLLPSLGLSNGPLLDPSYNDDVQPQGGPVLAKRISANIKQHTPISAQLDTGDHELGKSKKLQENLHLTVPAQTPIAGLHNASRPLKENGLGSCTWEAGSTPRDCLTENHVALLQNLQDEERRHIVRRIQKSRRDAAFGQQSKAPATLSSTPEALNESQNNSMSSNRPASMTAKVNMAKSVRMQRSSWKFSKTRMQGDPGEDSARHIQGDEDSSFTTKSTNLTRAPSTNSEVELTQKKPMDHDNTTNVLTTVFRMVGLTPRFSTALSEQVQNDVKQFVTELKRAEPDPSSSKNGYQCARKSLGRGPGISLARGTKFH